MAETSSPPSFPQAELQQALTDQYFGIRSFELTEASEHEACAQVRLLEGHAIKLSLTSRGYQGPSDQVFETVEDALQVVSPLYMEAKQNALLEKLTALAASRVD